MTEIENKPEIHLTNDESSNLSRATTCSRSQDQEGLINALWHLRTLKSSSQGSCAKKLNFLDKNANLFREHHCKVARTVDEASKLVEQDFDFVTEVEA